MNLQTFIKRHGSALIAITPLFIAGAGAFFPPWAAVTLFVLVAGAAITMACLFIGQQGRTPLLRELTGTYGMGKGTGVFYVSAGIVLITAILCWSTSFWGTGPSGNLLKWIASIPHNGEVPPAIGNIIGSILFVLLGFSMFLGTRYGQKPPSSRKQIGTAGTIATCLLTAGYAVAALVATPSGSIVFFVKYVSIIAVVFLMLSYNYDVALLFKRIRTGDDENSGMAMIVVILTALVVLTSVAGRFLNVHLVQAIDNLVESKLAEGPVRDLNIPLYIVSGLLIIFSATLLFARLRDGSIGSRGPRRKSHVQLTKSDGTIAYSGGGGATAAISKEIVEMIVDAVEQRASDIHIEPEQDSLSVRYRIDGTMSRRADYPAQMGRSIVASIKATADMDIAERRKPQDGRFSGVVNGKLIDFRVASTPMSHGEKIVIRVLDRENVLKDIRSLGFTEEQKTAWEAVIKQPQGIIIVCGPTGSGKTTTIYSTIGMMDIESMNVVTIEDPIEYRLPGVTQTAINEKAGVTFSSTMRSSLRQDPDVIFVGEVRDSETADVALQASMTGHLVLTTVHATDVCACLVRLADLGVNDKNIISFSAILSQRLVRMLCTECKALEPITETERDILSEFGDVPEQLMKSEGCSNCHGNGFRGRVAIYELAVIKDWMRDLFLADIAPGAVRNALKENGFKTMWYNGIQKALEGITTLEELQRVTSRGG